MHERGIVRAALAAGAWPSSRTQVPQVRIEVCARCGKECIYCRPTGEGVAATNSCVPLTMHEMTAGEIMDVVQALSEHGVSSFKLTGGEPMLREDIVEIVRSIKQIPGVASLHLVTRHARAGSLAGALREAGLDLLNFSVDSLHERTWEAITRVRGHGDLLAAVHAAAGSGVRLQISMVVLKSLNDTEVPDLIAFARSLGAELKLLDLIPDVGRRQTTGREAVTAEYADLVPIAEDLERSAAEVRVVTQPGGLGHPMPYFVMADGARVSVKSARFGAYYGPPCAKCTAFPCWDAMAALRVTPAGMLQFCLLRGDNLVDLLGAIRTRNRTAVDRLIDGALSVYREAAPLRGDEIAQARVCRRATAAPATDEGHDTKALGNVERPQKEPTQPMWLRSCAEGPPPSRPR